MNKKHFTTVWLLLCLCFFHVLSASNPVLILIGPPGSGKGSVAQYLKEKYHYTHLSAGDLIRDEIEKQTMIGQKVAEIVRAGDYIDAVIMHAILAQHITAAALQGGPFIIDNFGRNQHDIDFLNEILTSLDLLERVHVLYLEVNDAICRERIAHRLVCNTCHHVYNTVTNPPAIADRCEVCDTPLKCRINDTPEVIEKRLCAYRKDVEPYYRYLASHYPSTIYNMEKPIAECLRWCDGQKWINTPSLFITLHQ